MSFTRERRVIAFAALALLSSFIAAHLAFKTAAGTSIFGFADSGTVTVATSSLIFFTSLLCLCAVCIRILPFRKNQGTATAILAFSWLMLVLALVAQGKRLDIVSITAQSVRMATPIALGAIAGLLCERTGVINIAIEGMMLTGACIGYVVALYTGNTWIGIPAAIASGMLMSLFHALLSLRFRTDQIISGTVINILAVGVTGYIRRSFLLHSDNIFPGVLPITPVPILHDIPILGQIMFEQQPIVYGAFIIGIIVHIALFSTRWGLQTRACGEHPLAAATVGISVLRRRLVNILLSGGCAGLAGAWFSLETTGAFEDIMTNGKGFIALAAMIFGHWTPAGAYLGAFLFGFADALQIKMQVLGITIPYQLLGMLPYLITIIVLAGVIGRAVPPAAVGKPYPDK